MKRVIAVVALIVFLVAGSVSVAAQFESNSSEESEEDRNETVQDELEELREDAEQRRDTLENRFEDQVQEERPERSAQFEARLMISISSVEHLMEIAPDEESEEHLQNALESLREVQGEPGADRPGNQDANMSSEAERGAENNSREEQGSTEDAGPSQNENRPGFVRRMLSGIFG